MAFNIVVCAKQVPDTNEIKINPETGSLIRDGVPSILNPDDANALEQALQIKDTDPENINVTVVSMGPPQASDMLFECLAMGADRAILLSDRAVGGSDTWATSNAITAAINKYNKEFEEFTNKLVGLENSEAAFAGIGATKNIKALAEMDTESGIKINWLWLLIIAILLITEKKIRDEHQKKAQELKAA